MTNEQFFNQIMARTSYIVIGLTVSGLKSMY